MKEANAIKSSSLAQTSSPFFSKKSQDSFFGNTTETSPFFDRSSSLPIIQTKLTVGQPNDKYEQEADTMADKVVQRLAIPTFQNSEAPAVQAKPLALSITPVIQSKCDSCDREEKLQEKEEGEELSLELRRKPIFESNAEPPGEGNTIQKKCASCEQEEKLQMKEEDEGEELPLELKRKPIFESNAEPSDDESNVQRKCAGCEKEDKKTIQTKSDSSQTQSSLSSIETNLNASKGSGSPLPDNARQQMESSFGTDFSNVRIHNNSGAVDMNKSLNAQAFTHGSDIYFNSGKYDTNSANGQHLMAHELTHVLQQTETSDKEIQRVCDPTVSSCQQATTTCDPSIASCPAVEPSTQEVNITSENADALIGPDRIMPQLGEQVLSFRGIRLTVNTDRCKSQLLYLYHRYGEAYTANYIEFFAQALNSFYFEGRFITSEEATLGNRILPILRSGFEVLVAQRNRFAEVVKNAAVVQLQRNYEALGQWRTYVLSLMPQQFYGQAYAVSTRGLYDVVQRTESRPNSPFSSRDLFEVWSQTSSPHMRGVQERLMRGQIHGGCQHCHETNLAIQQAYRDQERGDDQGLNWRRPDERLPEFARFSVQNPSPTPNVQNWSNRNVSSQGTSNTISLNEADRARYPSTHSVLTAVNSIRTYIEPLGPRGYNVIPSDIFLRAQTEVQAVNDAIEQIDQRRTKYLMLINKIQRGGLEYVKLEGILNNLFPLAIAEVKLMVRADEIHETRFRQNMSILEIVVGIAALLLTIFPPTAPLGIAMGASLAAYGLYQGYNMYQEGLMIEAGRYSGVFSREQEEAASQMMAMGIVSMITSAFGLGTSVPTLSRVGLSLVSRAGRQVSLVNRIVGSIDDITFEISNLTSQQARVLIRSVAGDLIIDTSLDFLIGDAIGSLTTQDSVPEEGSVFSEEHDDVTYIGGRADIVARDFSEFTSGQSIFIQRTTDSDLFEEAVRQAMRRGSFQQQFGWPAEGMDTVIQGKYRGRSGWGFDAIGIYYHPNGNISIFIVEVKSSLNPHLAPTSSGTQMGRGWVRAKIAGIIEHMESGDATARRTYGRLVTALGLDGMPEAHAKAHIRRKFREIPDGQLAVVVRQHADLGPRRTTSSGAVRGRGLGAQAGGLGGRRIGRR